jgi:hypothetical protein
MSFVDRDLVTRLLDDESLSFREIGRRANCSDWSVRAIARDLAGEDRPMKRERHARDDYRNGDDDEPLGIAAWGILVAVAAVFFGAIWCSARRVRPPEI